MAFASQAEGSLIRRADGTVVGSVDEDFAVESLAGDIMLLGNTSWRIKGVEMGKVRVEDAHGAPPNIPFWRGEAPSRTAELSAEVAALRQEIAQQVSGTRQEASRDETVPRAPLASRLSPLAWLKEECGLDWQGNAEEVQRRLCEYFQVSETALCYYAEDDLSAPIASGSATAHAMIVAPCSMGTLSRIACGNSGNLIERCADVMLKEGRPLLLVPRETPLSAIHLENMLKLARLGCRIIPAMPAFYHRPTTIADQVDFVVGKVLNSLAIPHKLFKRWGG